MNSMDIDAWIAQFRSNILNSKSNCFDELIQHSSLENISYPNRLLMKLLWPKYETEVEQPIKFSFNHSLTKYIKWMNDNPSFWNELRYMIHCGIQQIIQNGKCSNTIIAILKLDGEKLLESDFKAYWNEVIQILSYQPKSQTEYVSTKYNPNKANADERKDKLPTAKHKYKNGMKELNQNQNKNEQSKTMKKTKKREPKNEQNVKDNLLPDFRMENQWKNQTIMDKLQTLKRKFNKLNLAYLFLRNYNIFNLSELIRKNLQMECSRPSKFNYYNILISDRIYQENQKLVKGIIRHYKYKRRTRAMSADDNENAIWIPNYKKKTNDEEYKIKNDRTNILCELRTAIINNNQKEILRLSIDKRIKLINTSELEKLGYFKAIQDENIKENRDDKKGNKKEEEEK